MLYVYHGSDITRVRTEAQRKAQDLLSDGGEVTVLPSEGNNDSLKDALGATSLFRAHEVFVLDTPSENEEFFDAVMKLARDMHESKNHFAIIESALTTKNLKTFTEVGASATLFTRAEKKEFNVFGLSDALCARDKKTLWILLQEAWRDGRATEELIGTLFWQVKMLRLAEITTSATEAGQKPFVYNKAKSALKRYKPGELTKLSHELTLLYHEGHSGKRNIDQALETWVLSL